MHIFNIFYVRRMIIFIWLILFLGQVLVIVEYAPCGNLRDFLRERMPMDMVPLHERVSYGEQQPTLVYKDLVSFAYQVARGMEYLSSKKVLNRFL